MPATLEDVARLAGVSIATVSRVVSDKPNVSEQSRQRVLIAINQLNYRPSRVARSLRAQRGQVIGLVVSDIQNPFFTSVVRAVEDTAYEHKYAFLLCNTDENPEKEAMYVDLMVAENVAGIILSPTRETDNSCQRLADAGIPVVAIDRRTLQAQVDTVVIDNIKAACELVGCLIRQGHRRIGAILGTPIATTGHERLEGYTRALEENGLAVDLELVRAGPPNKTFGFEQAHALMELPAPPTALFTGNNLLTLGALRALYERRLRVPQDVAVAAFDELEWMYLVQPSFPVVAQPSYEMGRVAANLLMTRMHDRSRPPQEVMLEAIVRVPHA